MIITKKRNLICDGEERRDDNARKEKLCTRNSREEKSITFVDVSKYFYMPITQAARELNVGLTLLKKYRELGIPRWPHRKMKILQTLIKNVQELEREEGVAGEAQLRTTIETGAREEVDGEEAGYETGGEDQEAQASMLQGKLEEEKDDGSRGSRALSYGCCSILLYWTS